MGRQIRTTLLQVAEHLIPHWSFLESFCQQDKKYKSAQQRSFDRYHKARPLPELADDTLVWIRTNNSQQSGRIASKSSEPRSYIVSTPAGQTRRSRSHVVPIPIQANSPETK